MPPNPVTTVGVGLAGAPKPEPPPKPVDAAGAGELKLLDEPNPPVEGALNAGALPLNPVVAAVELPLPNPPG